MNKQNNLQQNEPNLGSKKTIWIIVLFSVLVTILLASGTVYFWKNSKIKSLEKNLQQKQITTIENPTQNTKINNTTENESDQAIANQWKTYRDDKLDITFDYPPTWHLQKNNLEDEEFRLIFKTTELNPTYSEKNFYIVGINNDYADKGHPGWNGYCAVRYKNIEEFCRSGCEKLSNDVAIDFRSVYHGESGFSAIAYTNLSKKYPSICFEFSLLQVLSEIAINKGIDTYEVLKNYDVKSIINNREVSNSTLEAVDNFKSFAETIRLK